MSETAYIPDTRPWWVKLPDFLTGWIRKNPFTAVAAVLAVVAVTFPGCEGKAVDPLAPTERITSEQAEAKASKALNDAAAKKAALKSQGNAAAAKLQAELARIEEELGQTDKEAYATLSAYNDAIEKADEQTAKYREIVSTFASIASAAVPGIPAGVIPTLLAGGFIVDNRRKDRLIRSARERGFTFAATNPANAPSTPNIANTAPG